MAERDESAMALETSAARHTSSSSPDAANCLQPDVLLVPSSRRTPDDDQGGYGGAPAAVSPYRVASTTPPAPSTSAEKSGSGAQVSLGSSRGDPGSMSSSDAPSSSSSYSAFAETATSGKENPTTTMIQELRRPHDDAVDDVGEWAGEDNGDDSADHLPAPQDGPPRTVFIPPPMAPYAQLYYRPGDDKMVALLVVGGGAVASQRAIMAPDAPSTDPDQGATTPSPGKGDDDGTYRALARGGRSSNNSDSRFVHDSVDAPQDGKVADSFALACGDARGHRSDASKHAPRGLELPSGQRGGSPTLGQEVSEDVSEGDDELAYSRSSASGLSTAFSMETLANLSSADSCSSNSNFFSPGGSTNGSSSSSSNSNSLRSAGGVSSSTSDSTVVFSNNASRCRREPQEIVWIDEAWLADCESRAAPSWNNDRLALLHHAASWRDGLAEDVDFDFDDAMSGDSCGKLLLRSVAICKSKLKSGGATSHHHGGRVLIPKPSYTSSSFSQKSSPLSASSAGFLSGKVYDYAKL